MDVERSRRGLALFRHAVELEPGLRAAFLDRACAGDEALRAEVEALLAAQAGSNSFLERPPRMEVGEGRGDRLVGTRLGHYHLKRVISSGGMGTVYEAVQEHPRRTVAVKVMRPGLTSRSSLRRFEYEAQILGRLRHPGIAQIFEACVHGEAGADDEMPYFVMEYVPNARNIVDYAHEKKLDLSERLALFMDTCEAIHHGHQKGIIHRDLKPGNILVDSGGHVKVIDFGVARATDADLALTTLQTQVGTLVGTLQYMSPEQCEADPHDLDIRSDVYSLGVVLYQLLCSKPPYEVRDLPVYEAVRRIREERPARPSTTIRTLRGDLETILLKALEKDRVRRYQSADELRRDIGRYLEGRPISARPPSAFYHLRTFARRNKVLVGGVVAVFVVLVAGIIVATSLYALAEAARAEAAAEAESAQQINRFFNEMLAAVDPIRLPLGSPLALALDPSTMPAGGFARDVSVVEMARLAVPRIDETFANKPVLEALARETLGMTFFGLGQYVEAMEQLEAALALREERLGPDHPDTLRSMVQLGNILREREEREAALEILRPALEGLRRVHGEEHRYTLACATILAACMVRSPARDEGYALFEKTLEAQRRTRGRNDRDALWTMTEWAFVLVTRRRAQEAHDLASEAFEVSSRVLGPEDFVTLFAQSTTGCLSSWQGDFEQGERLLRSSLEKRRRILGDEHPRTCLVKWSLAQSLHGEENLEERLQLLREALAGARSTLPADHYWRTAFFGQLRAVLAHHGRYAEQEQLLRDRYAACREELGKEHPGTDDALVRLTEFMRERGRAAEGEDLHRTRLESVRARLGDQAPATLRALRQLASYQLLGHEPQEGAETYRKWLEATCALGGDQLPATLEQMALAAGELHRAGRTVDARDFVQAALAGWRLRCDRPDAGPHDFNGLAWLLLSCEPHELRDPSAALSLAEQAVALCERDDAFVLDTLATACFENGQHSRAIELQRRALAAPTEMAPEQLEALEDTLVRFLLRSGDPEAAERVLDERMDRLQERMGENSIHLPEKKTLTVALLVEEGRFDLAEPRAEDCLASHLRADAGDPTWQTGEAKALYGYCLCKLGRLEEGERLLREGFAGLKDNPLQEAVQARHKVQEWIEELCEKPNAAPIAPAGDGQGRL